LISQLSILLPTFDPTKNKKIKYRRKVQRASFKDCEVDGRGPR
jgi:hypothetical protein